MKLLLSLIVLSFFSFSLFAQGDQVLILKKVEFTNAAKNDSVMTAIVQGVSQKVGVPASKCEVVDFDSIEFLSEYEVKFQGSCVHTEDESAGIFNVTAEQYGEESILVKTVEFIYAG